MMFDASEIFDLYATDINKPRELVKWFQNGASIDLWALQTAQNMPKLKSLSRLPSFLSTIFPDYLDPNTGSFDN